MMSNNKIVIKLYQIVLNVAELQKFVKNDTKTLKNIVVTPHDEPKHFLKINKNDDNDFVK